MKNYTYIAVPFLVLFFVVTPVFAETTSPTQTTTASAKEASLAAMKADKLSQQSTNLKARATQEIDRRLAAMQELITKINGMKKLSTAEKSTLTTQVQTEITNLTSLKAKITADTDNETLKTDVKSVVTAYRVFALFIPKIHTLAAADTMGTTIDKLTEVSTKLEARIKEAETSGKTVTNLKTTLVDMLTKLADAKKQYESIITNVTPLSPEGYPGNKTTLVNARTLLTTGRKDLDAAAKDARTIITSLKAFRPATSPTAGAASSSATPAMTH